MALFHSSQKLTRKLARCENVHPITIFESTRCELALAMSGKEALVELQLPMKIFGKRTSLSVFRRSSYSAIESGKIGHVYCGIKRTMQSSVLCPWTLNDLRNIILKNWNHVQRHESLRLIAATANNTQPIRDMGIKATFHYGRFARTGRACSLHKSCT